MNAALGEHISVAHGIATYRCLLTIDVLSNRLEPIEDWSGVAVRWQGQQGDAVTIVWSDRIYNKPATISNHRVIASISHLREYFLVVDI